MSADQDASPRQAKWLGGLAAAMGVFLMLIGLGVIPASSSNDPRWVGFVAGLVFFLGGLAVMLQDFAGANDRGELPAGAPRWMGAAQSLIVLLIFGSFALIASYVAIGGDEHGFSGGIPFVGHAVNVSIARVVFGIGALLCWAATIVVAISGLRKIFRPR